MRMVGFDQFCGTPRGINGAIQIIPGFGCGKLVVVVGTQGLFRKLAWVVWDFADPSTALFARLIACSTSSGCFVLLCIVARKLPRLFRYTGFIGWYSPASSRTFHMTEIASSRAGRCSVRAYHLLSLSHRLLWSISLSSCEGRSPEMDCLAYAMRLRGQLAHSQLEQNLGDSNGLRTSQSAKPDLMRLWSFTTTYIHFQLR